jgi:hypothetical protein
MKMNRKMAGKVIFAGIAGMGIFIVLIFLAAILVPKPAVPDVPDGFLAGFLMLISVVIAMFASGALAVLLAFKDITSFRYVLFIPLCSGLVTSIVPLLFALLFALFSLGLLVIALIAIAICLAISVIGGLVMYLLRDRVRALSGKSRATGG